MYRRLTRYGTLRLGISKMALVPTRRRRRVDLAYVKTADGFEVDFLARYGFIILILLVLTPVLGSSFGQIIRIPIEGITGALLWAINLGVG